MALRNIVKEGDEVLTKKCRPVEKFDDRLASLLDDMYETMTAGNGVGLAAPQVGMLRRAFVIDIGEGKLEFVNPEIIKTSGKQETGEGCLSCPGEYGITVRPRFVTVKAQDRNGKEFTMDASDLLAKAICHENDHLDGILFKAHVIRMLDEDELRIVFMGTPEFAVPCLSALIEKHDVLAVFTQPDKPKGRKQILTPPPVKEEALKHNIPVYQPKTLKDGEAFKLLSEIKPDVIIVVAYGKILPKEILELPRYGCINVHASLLPKYRGAAPIQWSIIDGEKETGVTAMQMDIGLDTGDMIKSASLTIGENETADELHDRLSALGAKLIIETLESVEDGTATLTKQDDSLSNYASMLSKDISPIDFTQSAQAVHNKVRGLNSWPSATAIMDGKRIKIHKTKLADACGQAGEIVSLEPFIVACGSGAIEILELQPEGKKKMNVADFLRGHKTELHSFLK